MRISDWSSDVCSSDLQSRSVYARSGLPRRFAPRNDDGKRSGRLLGRQITNQPAQRRGQFLAMHHHVDHPVIEQIFGALEAFGELLADRILDHALAREADQRLGLADLDVAEHRIAGGHPASRSAEKTSEHKSLMRKSYAAYS